MSMLTALFLLGAIAFGLALFVFDYFFTRFVGNDDTESLAATMHEINQADVPVVANAKPRAKTANAS